MRTLSALLGAALMAVPSPAADFPPPEKLPAFFGLFALSGTVTVWLGSLLVGIFTGLYKTQQAGFVPIIGLLVLGGAGLFFVKGGGKGEFRTS